MTQALTDIFDVDDLIMSATTYYLGRTTIHVADHCGKLIQAWSMLRPNTRSFIERVVEEAFARDDYCRGIETKPFLFALGHDCDREAWERVRSLWKGG